MKSLQKLFGGKKQSSPRKRPSPKSKQNRRDEDEDDEEEEEDDDDEEEDDETVAEVHENERINAGVWSFRNLSKASGEWHFLSSAGGSNLFPSPPLSEGLMYSGQW